MEAEKQLFPGDDFHQFLSLCTHTPLYYLGKFGGLVLNFPEEQDVTEQCHMVETRESWSVRCGATLSVHSR